jgi:hypothetical protein
LVALSTAFFFFPLTEALRGQAEQRTDRRSTQRATYGGISGNVTRCLEDVEDLLRQAQGNCLLLHCHVLI